MTNTDLLREKIDGSGVKYSFLAERLGLSKQAFSQRLAAGIDFKAWEMLKIVDILHLSADDARAIFYPQDVDE